MHWKRILSALVLIPPFLLLIHSGSPSLFALVVSLVVALAAWEFARFINQNDATASNRKMILHAAIGSAEVANGRVLTGCKIVVLVLGY